MALISINPATDDIIREYEEMTTHAVADVIDSVHLAYDGWRKTSFDERSTLMREAAVLLQ